MINPRSSLPTPFLQVTLLMLAILRQRNFALLWTGQIISSLGDWILWIALPFYAYERTGSPLAAGTLYMLPVLASVGFGSLAGVFVDRWDRRRTMIMAALLRAGLLLLLLVTDRPGWFWLVYPVIFGDALIAKFFTPAQSALIPRLVRAEELLTANRLSSVGVDLISLIAPAAGGLLFGCCGLTSVVVVDSLTFLLAALLISGLRVPVEEKAQTTAKTTATLQSAGQELVQEWVAGLRLVRSERLILSIFTVIGLTSFGQGIVLVMWIVFVTQMLHGGAFEYGLVQVAVAAGGLLGAFLLKVVDARLSPRWLIGISGIMDGALLLATYNFPHLPTILVFQLLGGIASIGFFVTSETWLQSSVATVYLGRVWGTYNAINALLVLCGQSVAGLLGAQLGAVATLNIASVFFMLGGLVAILILPNAKKEER